MSSSPFVHLRSHSYYSIVDGLMSPKALVAAAAKDGQPALALTDAHRMFGTIEFYETARAQGVVPILGIEAYIDHDKTGTPNDPPSRILLLAENEEGYKRLLKWVSASYVENQVNHVPRIKQSWFERDGTAGVVALSGTSTDEVGRVLCAAATEEEAVQAATPLVEAYRTWFGDRWYLEVNRAALPHEDLWVPRLVALSTATSVPLVATHPIQFEHRTDYFAHEVRTCIAESTHVEEVGRVSSFTREQAFKTTEEMEELFSDLPEALTNARALATRLMTPLELGKPSLPDFPTPDGTPLNTYFAQQAQEGLKKRLEVLYPDPVERAREAPRYEARLEHEVSTIIKMGFPGYFMVVSDFISWSKEQGIYVGPGRGSGAGSLVAYALLITDLDPLKYNLLFERFLNPERVSMPDFDIDFCMNRRDEVITYVRKKYGDACVSQIATFGTMGAKAALRDAGRSLALPHPMVDGLAKMVPNVLHISLKEALEAEPRLKDKYLNDTQARNLIDTAIRLEGLPRSVGTHAGGVVIAPGSLDRFSPLYVADDEQASVVTQYDKDDAEAAGLVKFDFLGLKTLTILQKAEALVRSRQAPDEPVFTLSRISLDDKAVYDALSAGDSRAVFQLESQGMRNMLKQARPDRFEDIIALVALYRPGPMDLIPEYCQRKHGAAFDYPDPRTEEVLKETYGIMVYQEQVMQVAQIIGGYSLGAADLLRRAMGKKKPEEMAKQRAVFAEGAQKNGLNATQASEIFDLMETFAGYGFNKSHAAAYALISYQTAYMKTKYPAEYYTAAMNVEAASSKQDAIQALLSDARSHGMQLLPPDVNDGEAAFTVVSPQALRYGLAGLKGVSSAPINAIVAARTTKGAFTDIYDFCTKVGRGGGVNKTVVEALVRAGAFDSLHANRAALLAAVPDILNYTDKVEKYQAKVGAASVAPELFGDAPTTKKRKTTRALKVPVKPLIPEIEPWDTIQQLEEERKAIGFYVSGHPFDGYAAQVGGLPFRLPLEEVDALEGDESQHIVAGIVTRVHKIVTKKAGKRMAFLTLHDGTAEKDITLFSHVFERVENTLVEGAFVVAHVRAEADRRGPEHGNSLLGDTVYDFADVKKRQVEQVHIALKGPEEIEALAGVLEKTRLRQQAAGLKDEGLPSWAVSVYLPGRGNAQEGYFKATLPSTFLLPDIDTLEELTFTFKDRVKLGFAPGWVRRDQPEEEKMATGGGFRASRARPR